MTNTARRAESKVLSATRSQVVAASTAVTFDRPTSAIHANASGNLIGTLEHDGTTRTFVVVQGMMYPYAFKSIDATSAVQVLALFN